MLNYMDEKHKDILNEIKEKKEIDASINDKLHNALKKFKEIFTY